MDQIFDSMADMTGGDAAGGTAATQRAQGRESMFLSATVRRPGAAGDPSTLRVRNLSPGGMMVETAEPFVRGEAIRIELRNVGLIPAHVAWVRDGRVGISFDRVIDPRAARKAPLRSAGSTMELTRAVTHARRPALKIG